MGDGLTLNKQDEQRAIVLGQVHAGILGVSEAAALIGVGERQVRRLLTSGVLRAPSSSAARSEA